MRKIFSVFSVAMLLGTASVAQSRWQLDSDGSITWNVEQGDSHYDQIEMAGQQMATVLRWGVDGEGGFDLERSLIFPMLRTIPNDTHGSLIRRVATDIPSMLMVNGRGINREKVVSVALDGKLEVLSQFAIDTYDVGKSVQDAPKYVIELARTVSPSPSKALLCESYTIKNISSKDITVNIPTLDISYNTDPKYGVEGSYSINQKIQDSGLRYLKAGESTTFYSYIEASKQGQAHDKIDVAAEIAARDNFVDKMWSAMELDTPDDNIDRMFDFAKVRAAESIYKTKGGYMHGPGGERYYAAIWANDQAEYINPMFPFLGYDIGNQSAMNSFAHFARYMNDEYKPIPSSIIAEGIDYWNGAGDRGDAAMIAYGAARYALASGSKEQALELWPLIEWCLEYNRLKLTSDGVVASDSDELEGRFEAGDANLCTSSLYYDALLSSAYLAKELGQKSSLVASYKKQAKQLRDNIEKYFGATVEGYQTYRYYEGNDILRSWICVPLTVGIYDRVDGTVDALFSDRLWTDDGLLTQAGTSTFWDRSTLYALRGVYSAGASDVATEFLQKYSKTRLLGNHVPYAIEAYPEGGQRHLSAESALYCRIIIEGLLGIRPTSLSGFTITPSLPSGWDHISLKNIYAFDNKFSVTINRNAGGGYLVEVTSSDGNVITKSGKVGQEIHISL